MGKVNSKSSASAGLTTNYQPSWKHMLITAFILLHLYIIVFWGLPGSTFRTRLIKPVQDYVIWSGLWHSWDMFSPNPLSVNFSVDAQIKYADGTFTVWEFPRMERMGIWERFHKERWRKWRERVRQDAYSSIWDDTARWIARQNNNQPGNPPTQVMLIRHWQAIPPPVAGDYQPIPKEYILRQNYRFKVYQVQRGDL
jgi:hypothetical protein